MTTTPQSDNRLGTESSPYLLQHAHNPVDWYPWGEAAFAKARAEDKPIFLSIGYSTCHWCHVMAHESFENAEVAAVLNHYFVSIKVDREQRPDIDSVYMTVCQALTQRGGWPLSIIMTPEQKPFFAGTYYPPEQLISIVAELGQEWQQDAHRLREAAEQISQHFRSYHASLPPAPEQPDPGLPAAAFAGLSAGYDARYGGFGQAPKFPLGHNALFLWAWHHQYRTAEAREMACRTLDMIYRGGIHDQIGGGFARYATDTRWLIPHFEKMLYDNALLLMAYAEAYHQTGQPHYKRAAMGIVGWLEAEMLDAGGAYYAAQDADSAGTEGAYYIWQEDEIDACLGDAAAAFKKRYDVTKAGNFEGANILNLLRSELWQEQDSQTEAQLKLLYAKRKQRLPLHTDDKILTAWNALLLAALARAAGLLVEPHLLVLAQDLWAYLREQLLDEQGRPLAGRRKGSPLGPGLLDDYAALLWALTELHKAAPRDETVSAARLLASHLQHDFWDSAKGGFFLTAAAAEPLLFRPQEYYDGALPSGNALAAYGLTALAALEQDAQLQALAGRCLAAIGAEAAQHPSGYCFAMLAQLKWQLNGPPSE